MFSRWQFLTAAIALLAVAASAEAAPELLVLDAGYREVRRFDGETGAFLGSIGRGADLYDSLHMVRGPDGNLYVADYTAGKVMKLDGATGGVLGEEVFFGRPEHLRFGPDGDLYMSLSTDHLNIRVLDPQTLTQRRSIPVGRYGDFLFGPDGRLYVQHTLNVSDVDVYDPATGSRIDFDPSTPQVDSFVNNLDFPRGLLQLNLMAFGPDGDLFTIGFYKIKRYDGQTGRPEPDFLSGPLGEPFPDSLTFGPDGLLYVTYGEGRIDRFDPATGASLGTFITAPAVSAPGSIVFVPEPGVWPALVLSAMLATLRRRQVRHSTAGVDVFLREPKRPKDLGRTSSFRYA